MDFELNEEQKMLQSMVRDFTVNEIEPRAAEIDQTDKFPHDLLKRFAEMELFGLFCPPEYGGSGMGFLAMVLVEEQIAQSSAMLAGWIHGQNGAVRRIHLYGTDEHKQKYLAPLAQGEILACQAFTEPETGSDPKAIRTTAKLVGDEYVLNGEKRFITRASVAQIAVIYAKTEDGRVSAFLVETNTPGFSTGPVWDKLGWRGSDTRDVFLDDVRIPRGNLLGKPGEGFQILMEGTATGKLGWSATGIGLTQAALDESIKYAKERMYRGRPIAELLSIQGLLAEITAKLEASRWLTYRGAWLKDQGADARQVSQALALAKFFSSTNSVDAIRQAMQIHGAYGVMKDFKIERLYRDVKFAEVVEGNVEIQRVIIAHNLLRE
ncbi:acyl-CoA dehydrogenase family protein [Chloroflexota bacterium]